MSLSFMPSVYFYRRKGHRQERTEDHHWSSSNYIKYNKLNNKQTKLEFTIRIKLKTARKKAMKLPSLKLKLVMLILIFTMH